jgi:type IV secretion system protein VirD4
MYVLSRLLLVIGVAAGGYCAAIATVVCWPASGIIIFVCLAGHVYRKRNVRLTTLGSARWSEEQDLRGMLDADSGLILGRLLYVSAPKNPRLSSLFAGSVSSAEACQRFWLSSHRKQAGLVRLSRATHISCYAPSGLGKGVSLIVPYARNSEESCVFVDFKGELARLTADWRRKRFGHHIVLLDPFKVVTQKPDCFNSFDFIGRDSPTAIDECNDMADAAVERSPDEKEPHWNMSAVALIAGVSATIVRYGGPETRSLQTVREILSHPQKLDMAIKLMCESDAWGGMLARMGGQLSYFADKEKNSVLTTVGRHLRFLDSLAVAESTRASSFDPAKLREGKMTIYLILPPEHMRAQAPLLRVWISSLLRACVRGGLQE